jgi:hypothetical protein
MAVSPDPGLDPGQARRAQNQVPGAARQRATRGTARRSDRQRRDTKKGHKEGTGKTTGAEPTGAGQARRALDQHARTNGRGPMGEDRQDRRGHNAQGPTRKDRQDNESPTKLVRITMSAGQARPMSAGQARQALDQQARTNGRGQARQSRTQRARTGKTVADATREDRQDSRGCNARGQRARTGKTTSLRQSWSE